VFCIVVCDVFVVLAARAPLQSAVSSQNFILVSNADCGLELLQVQTLRKFKLQLTLVIWLLLFCRRVW